MAVGQIHPRPRLLKLSERVGKLVVAVPDAELRRYLDAVNDGTASAHYFMAWENLRSAALHFEEAAKRLNKLKRLGLTTALESDDFTREPAA